MLATALLTLVVAMPFVIEYWPVNHSLLQLFVDDAPVRRSSIAGAIGLIVTAFVFFRPSSTGRKSPKKSNQDSIAGA